MKSPLVLLVALAAAAVLAVATASSDTKPRFHVRPARIDGLGVAGWHRRAVADRRLINRLRRRPLEVATSNPAVAIRLVFGRYAGEAWRVAGCETGHTYSTRATNGQYLGLFQMGARERALYGDGTTALEQTRAAFVYFVVSGRDWSPWSCKP